MAFNSVMQLGKSAGKIQNGMLYCLRMCYQESNKSSSSGQVGSQTENATYGAPEYFQYDEYSFNDIHLEMAQYRLPRLSSKASNENKK